MFEMHLPRCIFSLYVHSFPCKSVAKIDFFLLNRAFFLIFLTIVLNFFVTLPQNISRKYKLKTQINIMKALKLYGGSILILLVTVVLAVCFYTDSLQDPTLNTVVLAVSFVLVVLGVILNILGGKAADKIGGK